MPTVVVVLASSCIDFWRQQITTHTEYERLCECVCVCVFVCTLCVFEDVTIFSLNFCIAALVRLRPLLRLHHTQHSRTLCHRRSFAR